MLVKEEKEKMTSLNSEMKDNEKSIAVLRSNLVALEASLNSDHHNLLETKLTHVNENLQTIQVYFQKISKNISLNQTSITGLSKYL